jgi:hypothetical protein
LRFVVVLLPPGGVASDRVPRCSFLDPSGAFPVAVRLASIESYERSFVNRVATAADPGSTDPPAWAAPIQQGRVG